MSQSSYSAVVVNHNGADYIGRCLDALLAQVPPPAEVIVVDSGSTDGSPALIEGHGAGVRLLDAGGNVGPGLARNLGVGEAVHEDCLLLDNDAILEPGAVAALFACRAKHRRAELIQARSLCGDAPTTVHYDASDVHYLGTLILHNWYRPLNRAKDLDRPVGACIGLCFLVRKAVFEEVGGFDPNLFFFFEDTEFSYRVRLLGHQVRLCPDAHVLHLGGTTGLSMRRGAAAGQPGFPVKRTFLHSRNRPYFLLVCFRWRTLLMTAPAQLVYEFLQLGFAVAKGQPIAWVRGKWALLRLIPEIRRRRRMTQGLRRIPDRDLLVGSAMTLNPGVATEGWKARLRRGLDSFFGGWWRWYGRHCG